MVEGHGVHRVAASARRHLVGKRFTATSPNGRFAHGAEVIDAKELKRVEAIGKNLFYFFNESDGPEAHVMHVHFGMSGRFATHHALPGPDPTATTRLRLESKEHGICALLSAMTVDIGDCTLFQTKRAKLATANAAITIAFLVMPFTPYLVPFTDTLPFVLPVTSNLALSTISLGIRATRSSAVARLPRYWQ